MKLLLLICAVAFAANLNHMDMIRKYYLDHDIKISGDVWTSSVTDDTLVEDDQISTRSDSEERPNEQFNTVDVTPKLEEPQDGCADTTSRNVEPEPPLKYSRWNKLRRRIRELMGPSCFRSPTTVE